MPRSIAFALLAATLCCGVALADDYQVKMLRVSNPFARATPPGAKVAGVFMSIENRGKEADRLVSASSPVAGVVEIHEMAMDSGMMKMRAIKGVDVKPGATVDLKPGGYHVMLLDLKQTLKAGDSVPVTLVIEGRDGKRETVEIKAPVKALGGAH